MIPLLQVMHHPVSPSQVKVGIMDDPSINAANAGNDEFYVTTALLQKASDDQLMAVMAHEIAHQDLGHVAKAQALGTGLNTLTWLMNADGSDSGGGFFKPGETVNW